jgi:hypothetical protein
MADDPIPRALYRSAACLGVLVQDGILSFDDATNFLCRAGVREAPDGADPTGIVARLTDVLASYAARQPRTFDAVIRAVVRPLLARHAGREAVLLAAHRAAWVALEDEATQRHIDAIVAEEVARVVAPNAG